MARPAVPIVSLVSLLAQTAFSHSITQIPKSKSEPILSHPYGIIFSADGNHLYVAGLDNNRILVFDGNRTEQKNPAESSFSNVSRIVPSSDDLRLLDTLFQPTHADREIGILSIQQKRIETAPVFDGADGRSRDPEPN